MKFDDNQLSIGRTPLVKTEPRGRWWRRHRTRQNRRPQPGYSVKCRIGASMVWDAEKRGVLTPARSWWSPPAATRGSALAFGGGCQGLIPSR